MSEFDDTLNKILSSPEDMAKILNLARSFTGSSSEGSAEGDGDTSTTAADSGAVTSSLLDLDPKILRLISRLASEYTSGKNDKAELLNAIKPYLREDRHAKIDKATEIAKLARLARVAFSELSGGDSNV